jgi:hypothetical protein
VANPLPANGFAVRFRLLFSSSDTQYVFEDFEDSSNRYALLYTSQTLQLYKIVGGSAILVQKTSVPVGTVLDIGARFEGDKFELYYNGVGVGEGTNAGEISATSLYLGQQSTGADNLNGSITDFQVYTGSDLETWASDTTWST